MNKGFVDGSENQTPILVDFHADWCGPCITLAPIVEEVTDGFGEKLKFLKVDIDQNKALAVNFGIRSVPTLILFKEGKQVWKQSGLISKRDLKEIIQQYI